VFVIHYFDWEIYWYATALSTRSVDFQHLGRAVAQQIPKGFEALGQTTGIAKQAIGVGWSH
jgi:hypothetical protein